MQGLMNFFLVKGILTNSSPNGNMNQ